LCSKCKIQFIACKAKKELHLFKVDFEKAYDLVDWNHLETFIGKINLFVFWPSLSFIVLLTAEGLNFMMNSTTAAKLFSSYSVDDNEVVNISHLRFADDTLLLREKSWANDREDVLILFELLSRLKVNFCKSMMVGLNVSNSWLVKAALILNCRTCSFPFVYLGFQLMMIRDVYNFGFPYLIGLKRDHQGGKVGIYVWGHLVFLKSFMSSLRVYFLSFFKAPTCIISSIESLFKCFFGWLWEN